jgi:hypothetical protein
MNIEWLAGPRSRIVSTYKMYLPLALFTTSMSATNSFLNRRNSSRELMVMVCLTEMPD